MTMANKIEKYHGFLLSWQDPPLMSNMWQVHVSPDDHSLLDLIGKPGGEIISGHSYDEAIAKARAFVDRLLGERP